jgi:hypothetical protein
MVRLLISRISECCLGTDFFLVYIRIVHMLGVFMIPGLTVDMWLCDREVRQDKRGLWKREKARKAGEIEGGGEARKRRYGGMGVGEGNT